MQHRVHLVLQPRPMPHQRRPQPHLLSPRLCPPVRLPRLRQQVAAQQVRQRGRVHPVVLQLGTGNRLDPLRMHQHQPFHFRFHHFAKRRPEAACLHCHLYFLPPKLPKIPPQRQLLVGHCPRLQNLASCFQRQSCNKISGEDLRQRGSSRASFRACASSTYSILGGTLFLVFITSERRPCVRLRTHGRSRRTPIIKRKFVGNRI